MLKDLDLYKMLIQTYGEGGHTATIKALCAASGFAYSASLNNKLMMVRLNYERLVVVDTALTDYMQGDISQYKLRGILTKQEQAQYSSEISKAEEVRKSVKHIDRHMQVIYITGKSGSGKTTLAKYLANKIATQQGDICYNCHNSEHPFDDYDGECVAVWNDVRGNSTFKPEEWLQLLDNNTNSKQAARFHDVDLHNLKVFFLTSVDSLSSFVTKAARSEDKTQFYRRFGYQFLEINKENGNVYLNNIAEGTSTLFMLKSELEEIIKKEQEKNTMCGILEVLK